MQEDDWVADVLIGHTGSYVIQKGSIEGPMFKLPFMGPFLQSVNPKFEEYYAKWMSGPLSCVSVFHKYEHDIRMSLEDVLITEVDSLSSPPHATWRARFSTPQASSSPV